MIVREQWLRLPLEEFSVMVIGANDAGQTKLGLPATMTLSLSTRSGGPVSFGTQGGPHRAVLA